MAIEASNTANPGDLDATDGGARRMESISLDKVTFEANWRTRRRLSDAQWSQVMAVLPGRVGVRARNGGTARRYVEAVLWMAHTRAYWSDIPSEYGGWHAIYIRYGRWAHEGVWSDVVNALQDLPETQALLDAMVKQYLVSHRIQRLRGKMK